MTHLRHAGITVRSLGPLAAVTMLGMVATVALAQGGLSTKSGGPAGAGAYAAPLRAMGASGIEATPGMLAFASALAPDGAPSYDYRQVPGNGRNLFEIRLGNTPAAPPGIDNGTGLVVGAITTGPTSGTTSLIAGVLDVNKLFDPVQTLPALTTVVASGSIFSLGGGCARGTQTDFPYINANRPAIMHYNGTTFGVVVPTLTGIAPTNQYDSAECVVIPGANRTVYAFTNRTLGRVEIWKDDAGGFQPLQTTQITGVATPFGGGLRLAMSYDIAAGELVTMYQETGGRTVTRAVNVTSGAPGTACEVANSAPPTGFTRPREASIFISGQGVRIEIGDFDNNGSTEIVRLGPGCTRQTFPAGSSAGGNGYNWNSYGVAVDDSLDKANVLWGDYFYLDDNTNYVPQAAGGPFPGRGGPFSACAVRTRDGANDVITVTPGILSTIMEFSRGSVETDRISVGGNEDPGLLDACIRTTFSF